MNEKKMDVLLKIHNINKNIYELPKNPLKISYKSIKESEKKIENYQEIKDKIDKDALPLKVAIVGGFNTGKSTLVNSILQEDLLAVKLIPATAKVSTLKYSDTEKIIVHYKDGNFKKIKKKEYKKISHHSPKNDKLLKNIERFEIFYPNEILRDIHIIDTPGLFSSDSLDDSITKEWIEKSDVLLWVFDCRQKKDIAGDEQEIINSLKKEKVFAILNKMKIKKHKTEEYRKYYQQKKIFNLAIPYDAKDVDRHNKKNNYEESQKILRKFTESEEEELIIKKDKNKLKFTLIKNGCKTYDKSIYIKKVNNSYFFANYLELKKNLENLHKEIKDLKNNSFNKEINIYCFEQKEKLKKQKVSLRNFKNKKLNLFKEKKNLILDFKKKILKRIKIKHNNLFTIELFHKLAEKLNKNKSLSIKAEKRLLIKTFSKFSEDIIIKHNNFIIQKCFPNKFKIELKEIKFWQEQLIEASLEIIKSIKIGNWKANNEKNLPKKIDELIPDEQWRYTIEKIVKDKLNNLIELLDNNVKKDNELIDIIINKINNLLFGKKKRKNHKIIKT